MANEPTTTNTGLIVPNTGSLVGTWSSDALNPNFSAIDGYQGGVQPISVSNAPITLTSPAGFTPTPSGGPTQAQNNILSFTGALTANVQVTLPLPGSYIIENLTTGNFVLTFAAANSGEVVSIDQGETLRLYNNGTNVRFVGLGRIGSVEIWGGVGPSMPAWVGACTKPPYLRCDGLTYNVSDFPYLGARLGSKFGGNGVTTFAVPDLWGRVPLPYDATGVRITTGVCGINGELIGSAGGDQNTQAHTHTFSGTTQGMNANNPHTHAGTFATTGSTTGTPGGSFSVVPTGSGSVSATDINHGHAFSGTTSTFASGGAQNVQPSIVTGIAVIRAA